MFYVKKGMWILRGRCTVKRFITKCIPCKKVNCRPFSYPKPTDYINDHVNFSKSFRYTYLCEEGDSSVKMYIVIFTWLNIRAYHLEIVPSLSCQDFLKRFIQICSAHTIPKKIFSDNAYTFLQAMGIITRDDMR